MIFVFKVGNKHETPVFLYGELRIIVSYKIYYQ